MQGSMLTDEGSAINAHNLFIGKGGLQHLGSFGIQIGLSVRGVEYSLIEDKEVCVSGWKTLTIFIKDGSWHGKR